MPGMMNPAIVSTLTPILISARKPTQRPTATVARREQQRQAQQRGQADEVGDVELLTVRSSVVFQQHAVARPDAGAFSQHARLAVQKSRRAWPFWLPRVISTMTR